MDAVAWAVPHTACNESALVHAPGLLAWERDLLRDCPTSRLGDIRPFPVSTSNSTAAAHFVLIR